MRNQGWRGKLNGQVSKATWNARVLGGEWRITQRIENTVPIAFCF